MPENGETGAWEKELERIIGEKERELGELIRRNNARKEEEAGIVGEIEAVIEDRCTTVTRQIEPNEELGIHSGPVIERRPYVPGEGTSDDDGINPATPKKESYPHRYEIELVMPAIPEPASVNLLFRTVVRGRYGQVDKEPEMSILLEVFHSFPDDRLESKGILEMPYGRADLAALDDFVKGTLLGFIESWFARKIGHAREPEREYELRVALISK